MERPEPIRPFLRWAGSKRQLLPVLSDYSPRRFGRYLEPFLGSGSLFFHLRPARAILGDVNADLMATYEQVRDNLDAVFSELSAMRKGKEEYYRIRSSDTSSLNPAEQAARFIYLNRFSFNGLYRTNRKGEFNVPYGGAKCAGVPARASLEASSRALQGAELVSGDFEVVLAQARSGDFVYLDPPYSVAVRRVFKEYDPSNFCTRDLQRLRRWLDRLTEVGAEFLLSYAKCEEAELLMEGYAARQVAVRRNIAGFSRDRRRAQEWLISNMKTLGYEEA